MENKTVAVGMSGGVDSSTVAYLLKEKGYNVIGITMKLWNTNKENIENVIKSAKEVCDYLGIKHYVADFEDEFKKEIVDYFIKEYENGKTPNPCVLCNKEIKLGKLIDFARNLGADYFATGHYAKLENGKLCMGDNPEKDQVYFLAQINKENLKYLMFPLGDKNKTNVREIAKNAGIKVHDKKDSQEICFVENDDYKKFLIEMTNGQILKEGNIINEDNEILGKHECSSFYTIGQRKGLGISSHKPLYVIKIDNKNNNVIVGDNDKLFKNKIEAENINLLSLDKIEDLNGKECFIKARSREKLNKAKLEVFDNNKIRAILEENTRAVTSGQLLVFYDLDNSVIGSGFII